MKTTIQDLNNIKKVATETNKPQSNSAFVNNREIIVTYSPSKLYPFSVKIVEGEFYETALFSNSEVNMVRNIWNKFVLGNYSKDALLQERAAAQQFKNSLIP